MAVLMVGQPVERRPRVDNRREELGGRLACRQPWDVALGGLRVMRGRRRGVTTTGLWVRSDDCGPSGRRPAPACGSTGRGLRARRL